MSEQAEQKLALHWLVVGYVSAGARTWIEEKGGRVDVLSSEPPLVAVALAYDPAGAWTYSKGEQEHRVGVEYWNSGYIQEASTGIELQYRSITGGMAEYSSATDTHLILPDEDFDTERREVVEQPLEVEELEPLLETHDRGNDHEETDRDDPF